MRKAQLKPTTDLMAPPSFVLPDVTDTAEFQKQAVDLVKARHGTTTLGFVYDGGIIIAADTRATIGAVIAL